MPETLYRIDTSVTNLKDWRAAQRLSQRQAADCLGISQGLYAKLELGRRSIKGPKAKRIAELTGVPLAVLVGAA